MRRIRSDIAAADGKISNAADQVETCKNGLAVAEARLAEAEASAEKAKIRAAELHRQITERLQLAAICDPVGLRRQKLEDVLGLVNASLADLSESLACPAVAIGPELDVTMGGRPYVALSGSEQWRARAALQLEFARRDGSTMVLDGADILDAPNRGALVETLADLGLTALVCSTATKIAQVPDLAAAGMGSSWWIEGAAVTRLGAERKEAA